MAATRSPPIGCGSSAPTTDRSPGSRRRAGSADALAAVFCLGLLLLPSCRDGPERLDPAARQPRQRTLEPGARHRYVVDLNKNQYLQLCVEQRGVDLVVTLLDDHGRPLLEVDNTNGADGSWGPERIFWVSAAPGTYLLELRGLHETTAGPYELRIESLRQATVRDRRRTAAERALAQGDALYSEGKRREAIGSYTAALLELGALGDPGRQADALFRRGRARRKLREHDAALRDYGEALDLYLETGNRRQQAHVLHDRGYVYYSRREIAKAFDELHRALPLWREVDDRRGEGLTLNELGVIYRLLGESQRALIVYDQALALWQELGNRFEESKVLHNRGRIYAALGKRDQALADLGRALEISQQLGDPQRIALMLDTLGRIHFRWHELGEGARRLQAALELRATGDPLRKAITLVNLGWVRLASGDGDEAREHFEQARGIFRTAGEKAWEARALAGLGWLLTSRGEPRKALEDYSQAWTLYDAAHHRTGMVETLLGVALAERRLDRLDDAQKDLERALEMIEDLRTRASADSELRATYFATWQSYYELYVDLLMELDRRRPGSGYAAAALAAGERARARSLLEGMSELGAGLGAGADRELRERERELARGITALQVELMQLPARRAAEVEEEQQELLRRYEKLRGQIRQSDPLYAETAWPRTLDAGEIQRQLLDPETVLLEYELADERSFLWAVADDSLATAELPGRREIEDAARKAYELLIGHRRQSRRRTELALAELSDVLLDGVAAQLAGKKRLVIVADGALQFLPFGALPLPRALRPDDGRALLVSRFEIVGLPSASSLAVLRRQVARRPSPPGALAVVADPVFEAADPRLAGPGGEREESESRRGAGADRYPRLTYAGQEADAILALVPKDEETLRAVGFDARREVVSSGELGRYRLVHFATHGVLDTEHPELSRLVLSLFDEDGRRRPDGLLHAFEIYRLELPAELVVLSGCRTALGRELRGEGLVGLARGFLFAGAARVLVSLWQVDDRATAELMESFYRNLLLGNQPAPAALRQAQLEIRQQKRWHEPYYWAGFVLQGEWRAPPLHPG